MLILTDQSIYYDIADAIRECLETDDTYLPSEMPDAIRMIPKVAHVIAKPGVVETRLGELIDISCVAPCRGTAHRQAAITGLTKFKFTIDTTAGKAG